MHEKEPTFTPIPYDKKILLADIVRELKIDVVILDTKGAAYHNYLPDLLYHDKHKGHIYWLPRDFAECDVLKLCIEEDFQYETSYNWHDAHGFTAILQKHIIHTLMDSSMPIYTFPFSVDTESFKPSGRPRAAKVGFAGTQVAGNAISGGSVYLPRELAYGALQSSGLLAPESTPGGQHIEGDAYLEYLQQYAAYLSCGSIYRLTPAKMVEIIASGGILVTDKTYRLDRMFPDDIYLTYNETASDLVEKVKELFNDPDRMKTMVEKGLKCIKEEHSHEVRIKWLQEIIRIHL